MSNTMLFSYFVEINPKVPLTKGFEYPFIEMEIVTPGRRYVSPRSKRQYKGGGAKFQAGDTLFARITPCLENGKIAQFLGKKGEIGFGSTEFFVFRNKEGISDPRYVFYLAYSDIIRKPAEKSMSGASGRQRADLASIKDLEIPAPPLPTQRKIASILSAYDDLIENNTRRIKILEEMAQTIYREWFVHFRFPGHEKVKMVESEMGLMPEGWEVKTLGEISQIHRGISYRGKNLVEEGAGLPFLSLKSINRDGGFRSDGLKWYNGNFKETQIAFPNDIIMAVTDMTQERRIVARSARVPDIGIEKYIFSMDLVKIKPNPLIQTEFLYALLKYSSFAERLKEYANGTNVLHLSPDHIHTLNLILPPSEFRSIYANLSVSIYQQKDILEKKSAYFSQTRDFLLPKLISGEVDVSELDVDISEV